MNRERARTIASRRARRRETRLGMAWFRRGQWARVLEVSADRGLLEDTYDEWLAAATRLLRDLRAQGIDVEKMDVDVEVLVAWCNERGLDVNGSSRSRYAAEVLRQARPPRRRPTS